MIWDFGLPPELDGALVYPQSELVRDAVFGSDWLLASEGTKRSLRIVMSRANQPVVIRVAGFIALSVETFYSVSLVFVSQLHVLVGDSSGFLSAGDEAYLLLLHGFLDLFPRESSRVLIHKAYTKVRASVKLKAQS